MMNLEKRETGSALKALAMSPLTRRQDTAFSLLSCRDRKGAILPAPFGADPVSINPSIRKTAV